MGETTLEILGDDGSVTRSIDVDLGDEFAPPIEVPGFLVAREVDDRGLEYVNVPAGEVHRVETHRGVVRALGADSVAVLDPVGGPLTLVHLATGDAVDVGSVVDRPDTTFLGPPVQDGEQWVFAFVGRESGAAVVPVDAPEKTWLVRGRVHDVRGDLALVVDRVSEGPTRVDVVERGVVTTRSFELAQPPLGARLRADGGVVFVAESGELLSSAADSTSVDPIGDVGFEPTSVVRAGADAVLVRGDDQATLLDLDGNVRRTWAGTESEMIVASTGETCAVFQEGSVPTPEMARVELIDLRDGSVIAEFTSAAVVQPGPGCAAVAWWEGRLVLDGELLDVGPGVVSAVDPERTRAVVTRGGGGGEGQRREQVLVDLGTGEETPLPEGLYAFA